MKKLLPARLVLKSIFIFIACLLTLVLLVGCTGKSTDTTPSSEQQTQGIVEEVTEEPGEEIVEELVEEPDEPGISDALPGKTDFIDGDQSSDVGAILGSPAVDMFLKIEGVDGESTDSAHDKWIEILSYSHGVSQPSSGAISSGGARSAERCDHQDFSVVKTLDKASPKLALMCSNGQHIPEVILVLCRDDGDKAQYMEYKMSDVIVTSVNYHCSKSVDERPIEEVTFNYAKIEWTYTELDPVSGKAKGDVTSYWDVVLNKGG